MYILLLFDVCYKSCNNSNIFLNCYLTIITWMLFCYYCYFANIWMLLLTQLLFCYFAILLLFKCYHINTHTHTYNCYFAILLFCYYLNVITHTNAILLLLLICTHILLIFKCYYSHNCYFAILLLFKFYYSQECYFAIIANLYPWSYMLFC